MIKKLEHVHQLHLPVHQQAQYFPVIAQAVSFPITARKGFPPLAASVIHSRTSSFCVRVDTGSIRKRSREACFKSLGFLNELTRDPQTSSGSKLIVVRSSVCVCSGNNTRDFDRSCGATLYCLTVGLTRGLYCKSFASFCRTNMM